VIEVTSVGYLFPPFNFLSLPAIGRICSRSLKAVIYITVTRREQKYSAPNQTVRSKVTGAVYSVFRQLGNGEFLHVASRDELEEALHLIEELNNHWPGGYIVRDSEGNDVDLTWWNCD